MYSVSGGITLTKFENPAESALDAGTIGAIMTFSVSETEPNYGLGDWAVTAP